jgi:hypothetical protein
MKNKHIQTFESFLNESNMQESVLVQKIQSALEKLKTTVSYLKNGKNIEVSYFDGKMMSGIVKNSAGKKIADFSTEDGLKQVSFSNSNEDSLQMPDRKSVVSTSL